MPEKKRLSIIIPCYNEEDNIQECISRIPNLPWETEIVAVNDGSQDGTLHVLNSIKNKKLRIVTYPKNGGKGYAFRQGLKVAKGHVVLVLDADMATKPEEIEIVVKPIFDDRADFVNATRLVYPMEKGAMRPLHVPANRVFALIMSLMIKQRLTDTLCGFKAFKRKMLFGKLKENSWMDFELIIKAHRNKMRITEVPIHYGIRKYGSSKMKSFKHGSNLVRMLIKLYMEK